MNEHFWSINKIKLKKEKKSYGIDLLDFIATRPANNKIRKQIVKNLMESDEFANEEYDEYKKRCITELQSRDFNAKFIKQKIGNKSMLELLSSNCYKSIKLFKQDYERINFLAHFSTHDLNGFLEKHRSQWMEDKFIDSMNFESDKYDMSLQTDAILSSLTIRENGKEIPLNEYLKNMAKAFCGENADIQTLCKKLLAYSQMNDEQLKKLSGQEQQRFYKLMQQTNVLTNRLLKNDEATQEYFKKVSKELDKIEMNRPWLKPKVKDTRSFLQKLKDGLININTLSSAGVVSGSLYSLLQTYTSTGSLTVSSIFAISMLFNSITNMCNSFKFGYNKQQRSI